MEPSGYIHEIGAKLESSTDAGERAALADLLGAAGLADAGPYLAEALAVETDESVKVRLRAALARLEGLCL